MADQTETILKRELDKLEAEKASYEEQIKLKVGFLQAKIATINPTITVLKRVIKVIKETEAEAAEKK